MTDYFTIGTAIARMSCGIPLHDLPKGDTTMRDCYYVIKIGDHYVGADNYTTRSQSQAVHIPAVVKALADPLQHYLSLHAGFRWVKVNCRPAASDPSAD
jgi:hypothetical protein